ncbi:MAG: hypothetical protein PHC28_12260 [Flavobacterium sp.]|uniref:hypothetical protein n=1 Tax=Flavobacterium sp. TaxID=239 RepID=UPI00262DC1A4|nr:hypothetical protein [Flavobacterium sp.]MDD5151227.1 hypothetical protein [Flavobacterium sp.]
MKNFTLTNILKKYHDYWLILQDTSELKFTKILKYDRPRPNGIIAYNISTILDEIGDEDPLTYLQISKKDKTCFIIKPLGKSLNLKHNDILRSIWFEGISDYNAESLKYNTYVLSKIQSKETNTSWNDVLIKCDVDYINNENDNLFDSLFPKDAILLLSDKIKKITSFSI